MLQAVPHPCNPALKGFTVSAAYAPLPYAFAHLGWPAGIIFLGLAGLVTWYTSLLLASLDRHDGHRHVRYCDLAASIYGEALNVLFAYAACTHLGTRCACRGTHSRLRGIVRVIPFALYHHMPADFICHEQSSG